jgi:hypothetical protein
MRTNKIISVFTLSAVLLLTGCEKQISRMDIDPVKKRLVLNGSLGPDHPFKIHVSSSRGSMGPELIDIVPDAEIYVFDGNVKVLMPGYDSMGFYIADWFPETNKKYKISVKAENFDPVSVTVLVPEPVSSTSLSKDPAGDKYPYSLIINDPPEDANIYMIRAWYQSKIFRHLYYYDPLPRQVYDTLIERKNLSLYSPDELIDLYADGTYFGDELPGSGEKQSSGFIISDALFNGNSHKFRFKTGSLGNLDNDRPYLFTELISVDKSFYDFAKSFALYYNARTTPFAEPVALLSNVLNGLGFVYGYSIHTDSILLKK